jgi:shikimate kinase
MPSTPSIGPVHTSDIRIQICSLKIPLAPTPPTLKREALQVIPQTENTAATHSESMNITLIGMSGVGKSRIGQLLAEKLHYSFIDIDRLMEKNSGTKLQEIIDCLGDRKFIEAEAEAILSIGKVSDTVISPGGSAIYSERALEFLKRISTVVFLNASLGEIKRRTPNFSQRGIVGLKEKGLERLFEERQPLYKRYADVTINIENQSAEQIVDMLVERLLPKGPSGA